MSTPEDIEYDDRGSADMGDIYDTVADSKASKGGIRIRDGQYVFEIEKLAVEDLFHGPTFIAEFIVRDSTAVVVEDDLRLPEEIGKDIKPNAIGTKCSYVLQLQQQPKTAPGNMKSFMLALTGDEEDSISKEQYTALMRLACGPTQPLKGALLELTTWRKIIQSGPNKDKPFTAMKWTHVSQDEAAIAQRRAAQEGKAAA